MKSEEWARRKALKLLGHVSQYTEDVARALTEERERCAKVAYDYETDYECEADPDCGTQIAAAIREDPGEA